MNSGSADAARLAALALRHAALEASIEAERARPVPDAAALRRLKRQKLAVRADLTDLTATTAPRAAHRAARGRKT